MTWWKRALIVSILWIALAAAGGSYLIHLDKKPNPARDETISETAGMVGGVGLVFVWFACFAFRKKPSGTGSDPK